MVHPHTVHLPPGPLLIWCTVCGAGAEWSTINAAAFNPTDDAAYAKFTDATNTDYLCKFYVHPPGVDPPMPIFVQCVCVLQPAGSGGLEGGGELNAATFHEDTYFASSQGRTQCTAHAVHLPSARC